MGRGLGPVRRGSGPLAAAVGLVIYTYLGYPLLMGLVARRKGNPTKGPTKAEPAPLPTMSVVIPAFNEEHFIGAKLDDVLSQEYPHALEVVVVSDGSTDRTAAIARTRDVRVIELPRVGKAVALNHGVQATGADIVCLTDANCSLAPGSLPALAAGFADPKVGLVTGAKTVEGSGARGRGEGLYWRYESDLKASESAVGCTMGAVGKICGVRRSAWRPIPPGTIADDVHIAYDVLARGWKACYSPLAVSREVLPGEAVAEFERRSRNAAGIWQTTVVHLRLADPRRRWVAVAFVSHRVLRSMVVPFVLPMLLVASIHQARWSRLALVLTTGQIALYGAAIAGALLDHSALAAPYEFALTNTATLNGARRYLTGRQSTLWTKVSRPSWADSASRTASESTTA